LAVPAEHRVAMSEYRSGSNSLSTAHKTGQAKGVCKGTVAMTFP
jgi:hypothetical protein